MAADFAKQDWREFAMRNAPRLGPSDRSSAGLQGRRNRARRDLAPIPANDRFYAAAPSIWEAMIGGYDLTDGYTKQSMVRKAFDQNGGRRFTSNP